MFIISCPRRLHSAYRLIILQPPASIGLFLVYVIVNVIFAWPILSIEPSAQLVKTVLRLVK